MAALMDIEIEQGATFTAELLVVDETGAAIDLTGYTARLSVKDSQASTTTLLSLTTENGRILITPSAGSLTLTLSASDTAALLWRRGVYDLELISAGNAVTRLAEGLVIVQPEVTT